MAPAPSTSAKTARSKRARSRGSWQRCKTVDFNHTNTACTFGANLTGTLHVVQNAGTTILTGTNTYTGNTVISNGTLAIAEGGALTFRIAGNGTNNAVLGTGSFQASGSFVFNLSAASTNAGDQWTVVTGGFAATYDTNFTVAGFNGSDGNWTNSANGVDYVFQQSTGVLTVGSPVVTNITMLGRTTGRASSRASPTRPRPPIPTATASATTWSSRSMEIRPWAPPPF